MTSCMRTCPSVEGSASPLITHRIGVDVCLARQRTFFHKCHRCIYRGQPADWEPEAAPEAIQLPATGEPALAEVGNLSLARRSKAAAKPGPARSEQAGKAAKPGKGEKTAEAG